MSASKAQNPIRFSPRCAAYIEEQEKNSDSITRPEIADYRGQFEKLKAARKRLAKFRPSTTVQAKAKAATTSAQPLAACQTLPHSAL
jgi:hypothetical protein